MKKQKMKKNDNIFSDLEDDISRSWVDIEHDIKLKREEEIEKTEIDFLKNNPTRFNAPNFKEFYEVLVEIYKSGGDNINALHRLLCNVFYFNNREVIMPMPKSFDEVWKIFCSPKEYDCSTNIICKKCNKIFDIMFKIETPNFSSDHYNTNINSMNIMNISEVYCPSCGYHIISIKSGELKGIFEHKEKEKENMEERGYDFKQEFGVDI